MVRNSELFEIKPDPFDGAAKAVRVRLCLYTSVTNASELRALLADGKLDGSLIKPELILEIFHVLAAANRAVYCQEHNKLTTKSVHTELVYSLSPTKNIGESLKVFGISDDSQNVLVAVAGDDNGSKLNKVCRKIKGKSVPLDTLKQYSSYDLIKQVYHVHEPELNKASIMDAILTRIVSKDYIA